MARHDGKPRGAGHAAGQEADFAARAAPLQSAPRGRGPTADPGLPRFVQLFLDAADVAPDRAAYPQ